MILSKTCEYGIRSMIYIAQRSLNASRVNVKEIAMEIDAPEAFISKILQKLSRANLLESVRGPQGGFQVDIDKLQEITLYTIIIAIDGDNLFTQCGLGLKNCSSLNPCPIHDDIKEIKQKLKLLAQNHTLYDLAIKTEQGLAWLKV